MLTFSGYQNRDLSILLVDNKKIRKMNRQFFDRDYPTNVISFSYMDGMPGEVLGDIIISVERADEEARDAGLAFYERLLALIVHGFVHIMGYDHEKGGAESRKMRYREKRFLRFISNLTASKELAGDRDE